MFPDRYAEKAQRWKNGAAASIEAGEYTNAVKSLTYALKYEPDNHRLYYNRAIALAKINKKNEALHDLKKAAQLGNKKAGEYLKKMGAIG